MKTYESILVLVDDRYESVIGVERALALAEVPGAMKHDARGSELSPRAARGRHARWRARPGAGCDARG